MFLVPLLSHHGSETELITGLLWPRPQEGGYLPVWMGSSECYRTKHFTWRVRYCLSKPSSLSDVLILSVKWWAWRECKTIISSQSLDKFDPLSTLPLIQAILGILMFSHWQGIFPCVIYHTDIQRSKYKDAKSVLLEFMHCDNVFAFVYCAITGVLGQKGILSFKAY